MRRIAKQKKERSASRTLLFAERTTKEILRDPLSFVFCLGLPVVMLVAMYAIFSSTAPWFGLATLTPGIAVFSNAFVMLYMTLLVSRDRATAFLARLYSSPMRTTDFVAGYAIPGVVIGVCQLSICYLTAAVMGLLTDSTDWLTWGGVFVAVLSAIPMTLMYVFVGILFGCLFSDKAAPGISSVIISAGGFLSGAWMPIETLSEGFQTVCRILPFYPSVLMGRTMLNVAAGETVTISASDFWILLGTVAAYVVGIAVMTAVVFATKTRREAE